MPTERSPTAFVRPRKLRAVIALVVASGIGLLLWQSLNLGSLFLASVAGLGPMWQTLRAINPTAFVILAGILMLEKLYPAKPTQRVLSVGFAQDLVWYFLSNASKLFVIAYWIAFLRTHIFDQYLWFLRVESAQYWPEWVKFLVGLMGLDFLGWFHHLVRHRITWLWYFHAIHHSQREMNVFTDFRVHIGEHLIAWSIQFIPAMALGLSNPEIFYLALIIAWHSHLVHANIRTNFGPLRYILVNPQSHRVHHSCEIRHFDKNYGVLFSIWDRMFGTRHLSDDEYPDTGIDDTRFPHECSYKGILLMPILQLLYPFRKIYHSVSAHLSRGQP